MNKFEFFSNEKTNTGLFIVGNDECLKLYDKSEGFQSKSERVPIYLVFAEIVALP